MRQERNQGSWTKNGGTRPHHNNEVWGLAKHFTVHIYQITNKFPDHEKFGLVSQLRRAAVSIPSNIAKEKARQSDPDFLRFLMMARGSAEEISTQMEIAEEIGYLDHIDVTEARNTFDRMGRALAGLIRTVRSDINTSN